MALEESGRGLGGGGCGFGGEWALLYKRNKGIFCVIVTVCLAF